MDECRAPTTSSSPGTTRPRSLQKTPSLSGQIGRRDGRTDRQRNGAPTLENPPTVTYLHKQTQSLRHSRPFPDTDDRELLHDLTQQWEEDFLDVTEEHRTGRFRFEEWPVNSRRDKSHSTMKRTVNTRQGRSTKGSTQAVCGSTGRRNGDESDNGKGL